MKIIIPMSGTGERFLKAGYTVPKPLLRVDGKLVIEHVVDMFPGEHDFVFICNANHEERFKMSSFLKSIRPGAKVVVIPEHKKGPVYAVAQAFETFGDDEEIIVSYSDFLIAWDYEDFKRAVRGTQCDGAIPCYTGFHPHLLRGNLYAGVLRDKEGYMLDIKEKHRFTEDPMESCHSCGIYYFRRGADVKRYFRELMEFDINLNGEYYVSMVYYLYKRDGKRVLIYEVPKFLQWGTPEDLEEYEAWSRLFAKETNTRKGITDIPTSREPHVKISCRKSTPEYSRTYDYWKEHFRRGSKMI